MKKIFSIKELFIERNKIKELKKDIAGLKKRNTRVTQMLDFFNKFNNLM